MGKVNMVDEAGGSCWSCPLQRALLCSIQKITEESSLLECRPSNVSLALRGRCTSEGAICLFALAPLPWPLDAQFKFQVSMILSATLAKSS